MLTGSVQGPGHLLFRSWMNSWLEGFHSPVASLKTRMAVASGRAVRSAPPGSFHPQNLTMAKNSRALRQLEGRELPSGDRMSVRCLALET